MKIDFRSQFCIQTRKSYIEYEICVANGFMVHDARMLLQECVDFNGIKLFESGFSRA